LNVANQPQNALDWCTLGEELGRAGKLEQAANALSRAVMLEPTLARAHYYLGVTIGRLAEPELSLRAFERAADLKPDDAQIQQGLAKALSSRAELARAIGHFQCALVLLPSATNLWTDYATCLRNAGRLDSALRAAGRACELDPRSARAHHERSQTLVELGRFDEALVSSRAALELEPEGAEYHTGLAAALVDTGQLDAGIDAYRRALTLDPTDAMAHGNIVFLRAFQVGSSAQSLLEEARGWARAHASPIAAHSHAHENERAPERRLRIGYVSSNFNRHCQALFTLPLLEQHNRENFELFAYASLARSDEVTSELRQHFAHWHDISRLDAAAAAALIRSHRIDILIDLTMHMSVSLLGIFACKPAPVQIAWLAYPGTTGLSTIDYRVTDRHLDPPDQPAQPYAERSLSVPDTFWCYRPGPGVPPVSELPARARGYITFGCLNSFWKLNDDCLRLWARVLGAVPSSRLVLLAPDGAARARVSEALSRAGVADGRVVFVSRRPRAEYLALYGQIDICLDTLPYNGHTTSLDAFYMGVPVVSLIGDTVVGRAGFCQAQNLGLPQLVSDSKDGFVRAATALCADSIKLAALRQSLRQRMQSSPLMDAPRFATNLEGQYREAWRRFCAGASA